MYQHYFGLKMPPFTITPDPGFLFLSQKHQEALAHLSYGIQQGNGFVALTGEVGTGKTTICRYLLGTLTQDVDVALIFNPKMTAIELLACVCDELKIAYDHDSVSSKYFTDLINTRLLKNFAENKKTVLIIDEAQSLSVEVLEQIRLLSNLETDRQKLLLMFLIGQPELNQLLSRNDLRQLSQRITARYHLNALSLQEARDYIVHRLKCAGSQQPIFTNAAIKKVYQLSKGIPRLMNVICDRALVGAYVEEKKKIERKIIIKAANEVMPINQVIPKRINYFWPLIAVFSVTAIAWAIPVPVIQQQLFKVNESVQVINEPPLIIQAKPVERMPENKKNNLVAILKSGDLSSGYQNLLALWAVNLAGVSSIDSFCQQVITFKLKCHAQTGNWNSLRNLNRPALITLKMSDHSESKIVVKKLNATYAEIMNGKQTHQVAIHDLDQYWHGDILILWRLPEVKSLPLKQGSEGGSVIWLRQEMAKLNSLNVSSGLSLFDTDLEKQVLQFQKRYGLKQDGIVGNQTMFYLSIALAADNEPLLKY